MSNRLTPRSSQSSASTLRTSTTKLNWVFIGPKGLRAGRRLLLFVAMAVGFYFAAGAVLVNL